MCYRFILFGRIMRSRYPGSLRSDIHFGRLLGVEAEDSEDDQSDDVGDVRSQNLHVLAGVDPGVVAPSRASCRKRLKLSSDERESLFFLLGYSVKRFCRVVKSGVSVRGQPRSSVMKEDASSRRIAFQSGVEVPPEHLPRGYGDEKRFGRIRYVAYVTKDDADAQHVLVARLDLFRKRHTIGPHGQTIVNPGHLRRRPFFVRLRDLGQCVAFVPTRQSGDGTKGVDVTMGSFWDREQYVVYCYPRSTYDE
jgi:hypothetical protein